jgi:glycosyltransferase involved in cell wall biosynthesis
VLVIPRGIYDVPRVPSQGLFESHQVAALRAAGVQVGVLSGGVITTRYLGRRFPYTRQELAEEVPVYRAYRRAYRPARWEDPIRAAERTFRKLKPVLAQYVADHGRPDVVHAHNLASGGLVAERVFASSGIPYVVTEHTGTYVADSGAASRDADLLVTAATGARALVAVGSHLAASLHDALGDLSSVNISVVPNVVDSRLLSCPLKSHHGPFTVAGLGNLIPSKNFPLLVEAFARAELPSESRLVIGGEGPEARRLADAAQSLGVEDRVHFAGHMRRDRVVQLLQEANLFAHPSNSESFGVVLIEAMAVGIPIVATASSGPQDIVNADHGLLTPVGDVRAFADGLSEMYRRRSEFNPEKIRETCRERFGPEAFASRMLEIYRGAVS